MNRVRETEQRNFENKIVRFKVRDYYHIKPNKQGCNKPTYEKWFNISCKILILPSKSFLCGVSNPNTNKCFQYILLKYLFPGKHYHAHEE